MNLTARQHLAAQLLASGKTGRQTAKELGINVATLSAWNQSPHFRSHLNGLLIHIEGESLNALVGLRIRAVERLGELLESASPAVALRAAEAVLARSNHQLLLLSIQQEQDKAEQTASAYRQASEILNSVLQTRYEEINTVDTTS